MKLTLILILNLLLCCVRSDDERTLSVQLNPGCESQLDPTQCEDISFVHIEAESANNTLHYIWDFTGSPSLFLAKTNKNTSLNVDWNSFIEGKENSVNFSSSPDFVFSAVIHKILLFEDSNDKANVNDVNATNVTELDPHLFYWTRENLTQAEGEAVMVISAAVNRTYGNLSANGTIAVKVSWWSKAAAHKNRFVDAFIDCFLMKTHKNGDWGQLTGKC
jgi:Lysosomal transcription factor, NCU-G1